MPDTATLPENRPDAGGVFALRLSRRSALLGAAALLAPLTPIPLRAATQPSSAPLDPGIIRLDSNENPYGPSPEARKAIMASISESSRYAEGAIPPLAQALAAREHLDPSTVIMGSGSSELLHMTAMLAADGGPGSELVAAKPTFEDLSQFAEIVGVKTRWVSLDDAHRHDLKAMKAAIGAKTRLVYVCNPNNPTGTVVPKRDLETFIRSIPKDVLVLVDEAYLDFITDPAAGSVAPMTTECPNLIVIRTFSKIHGLAGLRVGYGFATPALAEKVRGKQLAFPNIAGLRGALASLNDQVFLTETRRALLADRARVEALIDQLGYSRAVSQGNFVFFNIRRPTRTFAKEMLDHGIKIGRPFERYDEWARITIGVRSEIDRLVTVLPEVLRKV
jgi:histidinol-phosphate aminotransferase